MYFNKLGFHCPFSDSCSYSFVPDLVCASQMLSIWCVCVWSPIESRFSYHSILYVRLSHSALFLVAFGWFEMCLCVQFKPSDDDNDDYGHWTVNKGYDLISLNSTVEIYLWSCKWYLKVFRILWGVGGRSLMCVFGWVYLQIQHYFAADEEAH